MKKILVTAFEPFGGSGRNSSLDTLRALPDAVGGCEIVKREMPVEYERAGKALVAAASEFSASDLRAVVCLGQAEGRGNITPEYLAVNVRHASIADNAGKVCQYEKVLEGGENALFATLPAARIVERLRQKDIPASVSFSAGTYVCNSILYAALGYAGQAAMAAGFIHLPLSEEIAAAEGKTGRVPALPQATLTEGVTEALAVVAEEAAK